MSRLRVAPIVEGKGEEASVPILLRRIWSEIVGGEFIEVLRPIRQPRGLLVKPEALKRNVGLALKKLEGLPESPDPALVLILVDADEDCPKELAPVLLGVAQEVFPPANVSCVLANVEYETWFIAAAESLGNFLDLSGNPVPENPEESRSRKAWVEGRYTGKGAKYSETVDQPAMTHAMDLALCRSRSPSFDKLCRDLERFRR